MNDLNKNNLDDFFSLSMDHFKRVPSDNVWEGISNKLDEDDKRLIVWRRRYLLLALPFIGISLMGIFYFFNFDKIIETSNSSSVIINQEAKNAIQKDINLNTDKNETYKSSEVNSETNLQQSTLRQSNLREANQWPPPEKPKNHSNQYLSEATGTKTTSASNANQDNLSIQYQGENQIAHQLIQQSIHYEVNAEPKNNEAITDHTKGTIKTDYNTKFENPLTKTSAPLLSFPSLDYSLNLNYERVLIAPPIVIGIDATYNKYSIGITGRFANTFISDNNMFNGNESYGLRQEFKLTNKLAITNAIHFNIQHYDIEPDASTIEPVIVKRYTSRSFDDSGGVQRIESYSEYVDFSLGLKYDLGMRILGHQTFINPSLVAQLYAPQTFKFLDLQGNLRVRENKRIVMYLGSANLNFGVEKRLSNHLHLQVSIWGEHSFIPIGLQREKIKTLGISTSLIFGK